MEAGTWNGLEIVKLVVAVLTPLIVFGLGWIVNRSLKRVEEAQWASRTLIERRLRLFDEMAGSLNDLYCFFICVGDFRNMTPPVTVARKRTLDKLFHTNRALMSEEFARRYEAFIDACFQVNVAVATRARLRADVSRQRAERGGDWVMAWRDCFVERCADVVANDVVSECYHRLMAAFADDVGVKASAR